MAAVLLVPRETLSAPCSTPLVRDGESGSIAAAVVVVVVVPALTATAIGGSGRASFGVTSFVASSVLWEWLRPDDRKSKVHGQ